MIGRAVVVTEPAMGRLVELIKTGYSPASRDLEHLDSLERKLGQATVAYQPEAAARASESIHGGPRRPRQDSKTAPSEAPKARGSWQSA